MTSAVIKTRFYEAEMPAKGEVVMVKVESMQDNSAYVRLLEYDNIEGMIPHTELSRRRIRSINKFAKVGKLIVAQVIRLDRQNGYIDLSKKAVTTEAERKQCEDRYAKAKLVTSIMKHAAASCDMSIEDVMSLVAWPLYAQHGHAFGALREAVKDSERIFGPLNLPAKLQEHLDEVIGQKMKGQIVKMQADVNVTCYGSMGVEAIKAVLLHGQSMSTENVLLRINVQAPPTYTMTTQTEDREEATRVMWKAVEAMKERMVEFKGDVEVQAPPHVLGAAADEVAGSGSDEEEDESEDDE